MIIKDWINTYNPQNEDEIIAALREIMQEITLAGLARTDFFEHAAFYGGTALRIFHGLERYSEDLDFSLLKTNKEFKLTPYFSSIINEFKACGMNISINEKDKNFNSQIESAFLKTDTLLKEIVLEDIMTQIGIKSNRIIKIKLEVDLEPPQGFHTEEKLLLKPFSFYVKCFALNSLFAGKLHALLFRKWKSRVKGRDWFDFEWYIKKGVSLDLIHFCSRAIASGDWKKEEISKTELKELLVDKINSVSFSQVKEDVIRFIPDDSILNIWDEQYFKALVEKMNVD